MGKAGQKGKSATLVEVKMFLEKELVVKIKVLEKELVKIKEIRKYPTGN